MIATLSKADAGDALNRIGWGSTPYPLALSRFQRSFALGPALTVDGVLGPKTSSALMLTVNRMRAGQPTASTHFSWTEFACRCRGVCESGRIWPHRGLILALEQLRVVHYRGGLSIASGCRCPVQNAAVGGAKESQHMAGIAADIRPAVHARDVVALGVFSGIGANGDIEGLVRHVDVRHLDPKTNVTKSTTAHPARWAY